MSETEIDSGSGSLSKVLLKLVDCLIAALVFVLPFIMGGREAWGHWFLISTALLLGVAWAIYAAVSGARYSFSFLEVFFLAGLAVVWFQIQLQSVDVLQQFSTEYTRLLPAWSATQPGQPADSHWLTLSLTPNETRHALWMFVAYGVIGLVLFQRVRDLADCHRLLKWVGLVGVAMTGFGLLQWATSNGRFFWFYQHPFTEPTLHLKGAFTNRNHFAQFLALSMGPLLWWLFASLKQYMHGSTNAVNSEASASLGFAAKPGNPERRKKRKRSRTGGSSNRMAVDSRQSFSQVVSFSVLALLSAVAVVVLAVMLSLSRGGMIAAAVSGIIAVVGLWRGFKVGGAAVGLVIGGGFLFFTMLSFVDQEEVQTKVEQILSTDADKIDTGGNRRAIWAADAKVVERFPLLGTGIGSHRDVYVMYMDDYANHAMAELTHAESSFVQIALEAGLIGFGLLAVSLLLLLARLAMGYFRSQSDAGRACVVAVFASSVAGILHAIADFIWYVPAIVVVSLVLVVVGLKAAKANFGTAGARQGIWFPRIGWAIGGGFCILGLATVQPELLARVQGEKHWYASLRTALAVQYDDSDGLGDLQSGDQISISESKPRLTEQERAAIEADRLVRMEAAQKRFLEERIGHLAASLRACPDQHRVQLALAEQLLKLFDVLQLRGDNRMPLSMIRDAALASGFSTAEELHAWSSRAFGKRIQLVLLADKLARQSLAACPVQGYAYLTLAETNFLLDPADSMHQALVDQAMLVRGHDPQVRFIAGREASVNGDEAAALELWGSVFHSNQLFRMNVVELLARRVPVEFFLKHFQPNAIELRDVLAVYEALDRRRDIAVTLNELCIAIPRDLGLLDDEDEKLKYMMLAYTSARRLENLDLAVSLLTKAVEDFPFVFAPRYQLGITLVELERPTEALECLEWCYEQDPGNINVPKWIRLAAKQLREAETESSGRLTQL
ncbi:MAG: O-antigen ligase family protein [Fuerstiella sp.]